MTQADRTSRPDVPSAEPADTGPGGTGTHPGSGPLNGAIPKPPRRSSRARATLAEVVGLWSALYAFPAVIISTLDLPVSVKIFWLLCLLVPAGLITWSIVTRPHLRAGEASWHRNVKRLMLPVAAVASVVIALFSATAIEAKLPPVSPLGCVAVGSGNPDYARPFQAAYASAGGGPKLGCAITEVNSWAGGYQQALQGPDGLSIITAIDPAHVVVLNPDEYQGFLGIAGQGTSFVEAGYPLSGSQRIPGGWIIPFGGGDPDHGPSALLKQNGGQWYWVSYSFWSTYSGSLGGAGGRYGYPVSEQTPLDNGLQQSFRYGWLFYRADVGVLTRSQYEEFRAGKLHPSPAPTRIVAPDPTVKVANVYDVDSNQGTSYRLAPAQDAKQDFQSALPYIDQVGVIVGLNPANEVHPGPHYLKIQLLNSAGKSLASVIAALNSNVNTVVQVPYVRVRLSTQYSIRVTNLSRDVLGIYLNDPHRPGEHAGDSVDAVVNGVHEPGVLSGFVEARSARN